MLTVATKFAPIRSAFETALKSGIQAVEFWLDEKLLLNSDAIGKLALEYPFRYALHFPNRGPLSDEALRGAASLYHQLNCTAIIIHQPMFDRYGKSLSQIDAGLDLAIENHDLDESEFDSWAEKSPGLTLDVEHLWKYTLHDAPFETLLQRVDQLLQRHAKKLHHVHLPGYRPGSEEHQPLCFNGLLGREILTRLAISRFEKLVVSEANIEYQTEEFLKQDAQLYQNWVQSMTGKI